MTRCTTLGVRWHPPVPGRQAPEWAGSTARSGSRERCPGPAPGSCSASWPSGASGRWTGCAAIPTADVSSCSDGEPSASPALPETLAQHRRAQCIQLELDARPPAVHTRDLGRLHRPHTRSWKDAPPTHAILEGCTAHTRDLGRLHRPHTRSWKVTPAISVQASKISPTGRATFHDRPPGPCNLPRSTSWAVQPSKIAAPGDGQPPKISLRDGARRQQAPTCDARWPHTAQHRSRKRSSTPTPKVSASTGTRSSTPWNMAGKSRSGGNRSGANP